MARFSIRGLLVGVACIAMACAALKYAGPLWWTIVFLIALLLLMCSSVIALVGRGEPRAKSIGYSVCVVIYAAVVLFSPSNEVDLSKGSLPTTWVFGPIITSNQDAESPSQIDLYSGDGNNVAVVEMTRSRSGNLTPQIKIKPKALVADNGIEILKIAHLLWAMLFGFLGSVFAGFVYRRNH